MFTTDIFEVETGDKIKIKNPIDGSDIEEIIPHLELLYQICLL